MNQENSIAKQMLEALAEVNRSLRDHSVALRRSPDVTKAQTSPLEAVFFANGPGLEGHVEAVLANGDVVCWWLYLRWNQDSWLLEATVERKSPDGQETEKELPTETVSDFDGFLKALKRVVPELLALTIPEVGTASRR